MKNILQVTGTLNIGGLQKTVVNYLENINRNDYNFTFLVYGNEKGELEDRVLELGSKVIHIDLPKGNYIKFYNEIKKIMEYTGPYDIVHSHQLFNSGLVMRAAFEVGIPKRISHSHTNRSSLKRNIVDKTYNYIMRKLIIKYATDIVASSSLAGFFLFGENHFNDKGKIIANGIDTERFKYNERKKNNLKIKKGFSDKVIIGTVGNLNYIKNHRKLLESLPFILKKIPNALLIIAGYGPLEEELKEMSVDLNIIENVIFTGRTNMVPDLLNTFDVFAFPSLFEGLGISLVEAQSVGIPCVVSNRLPNEVIINENVIKVSPYDSGEKWANEIINALKFEIKHENLVDTYFGNDVMMKNLIELYSSK